MKEAYIQAYKSAYKKAATGILAANPFNNLDISDKGYASATIDAYLNYQASIGTNNTTIDIRGNDNPTAASAAARQTLYDNYVLVNYNTGYTP